MRAEALVGADDVRFVDARHGPDREARYRAAHLHGAVRVDLERDLSGVTSPPAQGGRHPLPARTSFARTLGALGITPATRVVVYDEGNGALAAARFWWMLRAVGHENVAVLDGGLAAAKAAGLPIDAEPVAIDAAPPYPLLADWRRACADIDEVDRLRRDPEWRVVDVRAADRYRGENETLDPVAGHIPGAINLPLTESLGPDGRFLAPDALRAHFEARLGVPPDRLVVSCGSGVTACHTLLALEHAGLEGARLYVGSWSEWCRNRGGDPA